MNVIDIVILIILVIAFVRGVIKGLFVEIAGILALILGIYAAINYSYKIAFYVKQIIVDWSDQTYRVIAFVLTFLLVVLLVIFIGKLLTKLADITALGLVNKLLGGVFGVLKIGLILSVCFLIFEKINNTTSLIDKKNLENSQLYTPIKNVSLLVFPSIIETNKNGEQVFKLPGKFK